MYGFLPLLLHWKTGNDCGEEASLGTALEGVQEGEL